MLIGYCFIAHDKDKNDTEGRLEEGDPVRDPLRKKTTIPRRVSQTKRGT